MQRTYSLKKSDVQKKWYLVDATDVILGRLATKVAVIIRGKRNPAYTPHVDCGDFVIVTNAAKIKVTGRKMTQKKYSHYSGYIGGLKVIPLETMLAKRPKTVIRLAVRRMLPHGPLADRIIKKLKIYVDDKHPHAAQKPEVIKF
jgi:large subunit ribosomal protein L13